MKKHVAIPVKGFEETAACREKERRQAAGKVARGAVFRLKK